MKKMNKNTTITLRVSETDKEAIQKEAKKLGMSMSSYMIHSTRHKHINIVPGGRELAEAAYKLYEALSRLEKYPILPVTEVKDTLHKGIEKINNAMEEGK